MASAILEFFFYNWSHFYGMHKVSSTEIALTELAFLINLNSTLLY